MTVVTARSLLILTNAGKKKLWEWEPQDPPSLSGLGFSLRMRWVEYIPSGHRNSDNSKTMILGVSPVAQTAPFILF